MLKGELPFKGASSHEILNAVVHADPMPLASTMTGRTVSKWQRIVDRCLAKAPEDRYPSANALLADLERLEPATASPRGLATAAVALVVFSSLRQRGPVPDTQVPAGIPLSRRHRSI